MSHQIARLRAFYARVARSYDDWLRHYERWIGLDAARRRMLTRAYGRVLEVGTGTGRNFSYYPLEAHITGVDLSPEMHAVAAERAQELQLDVDLRAGDGQALDFPDDAFDTVVMTLFLSTVPNPGQALIEALRVVRPGGQVLILDHARSPVVPVRLIQRFLQPFAVRFAGWHLTRDPIEHLPAGFAVRHIRRWRFGMIEEVIARKA